MIWTLSQQRTRRNCSTGEDAGYPRQDGKMCIRDRYYDYNGKLVTADDTDVTNTGIGIRPVICFRVYRLIICLNRSVRIKIYSSVPVSYTHLDVYKRQVLQFRRVRC